MKRTFLKYLPIAAAVLLATSCSKDNDSDNSVVNNPVETQNIASPTESSPSESNAVPFSIKVVTGKSLSKIGYSDNGIVTPAFTTEDVTNNLSMTISNGTTPIGTLTLKNVSGTFDGELSPEPADGTELTATITYNEGSVTTSSTISIIDLMENCAHTYTGTFIYKTDDNVMLTDDKAYFEIFMSPLQHNIDLTIGDEKQNFIMSDEGKVWIAVAGGTKVSTNFTYKKPNAGTITTIKREGLVDLGIKDILWADKNVGASTYDGVGEYYTFDAATSTESPIISSPLELPTSGSATYYDFSILKGSCTWIWTTGYNGGTRAGYIVFKKNGSDISKDPHIFLPVAGYLSWGSPSESGKGFYWSRSSTNSEHAYSLSFDEDNISECYSFLLGTAYKKELLVRAVRKK